MNIFSLARLPGKFPSDPLEAIADFLFILNLPIIIQQRLQGNTWTMGPGNHFIDNLVTTVEQHFSGLLSAQNCHNHQFHHFNRASDLTFCRSLYCSGSQRLAKYQSQTTTTANRKLFLNVKGKKFRCNVQPSNKRLSLQTLKKLTCTR